MLPKELIWDKVAPSDEGMTQKMDAWAIVFNIVKRLW